MNALAEQVDDRKFLLAAQLLLERRFLDGDEPLIAHSPSDNSLEEVYWFSVSAFAALDEDRVTELAIDLCDTLHSARAKWLLWISGRQAGLEVRFGIVRPKAMHDGQSLLLRALEGYLVGASVRPVVAGTPLQLCGGQAYAVTGIPSERADTAIETRLDEALDSLAGRDFDLLLRMEPVGRTDQDEHVQMLSAIASEAHSRASTRLNREFGRRKHKGSQKSRENYTETAQSHREADRQSSGVNEEQGSFASTAITGIGAVLGGAIGFVTGGPPGAALGVKFDGVLGGTIASAIPHETKFENNQHEREVNQERRKGEKTAKHNHQGEEEHVAETLMVQAIDRNAGVLAELMDKRLERIQIACGHGIWRTSAIILAKTDTEASIAGHMLVGALRGDASHLEPLRLLPLPTFSLAQQTQLLGSSGLVFERDEALRELASYVGSADSATWLSGPELAFWVRPPVRPIAGLSVRPFVEMASHVAEVKLADKRPRVDLGPALHHGRTLTTTNVTMLHEDLTRHCLVAGTTGSGKTTTVRQILKSLQGFGAHPELRVPFMVIEPAKTEYRGLFEELKAGGRRPVRLVPNPSAADLNSGDAVALRFNPFQAPVGVSLGRHFEATKILLRSCFSMQESLPQILEATLLAAYLERSWSDADFALPVPELLANRTWPTFDSMVTRPKSPSNVVRSTVAELGYEERLCQSFTAAVLVRLRSFAIGAKGLIFSGNDKELDWNAILQRPIFIELSEIPEPDVRRFLVGALMIRLSEVRALQGLSAALRHLVVLEEAHHVLRQDTGLSPSAALIRESNLLLADAFAEMRAYGQGILVADQSPAELEPAILRNTGTKLLHTSYYEPDVQAVADSIGMEQAQRQILRQLRPGECVAKTPELLLPVLCKVSNV